VIFTGEMSWGEAISLGRQLASDPSSRIAAALNGWDYPLSREALILADLFDATAAVHFKKPKPYPRPTDRSRSKKPTVPQSVIRAALAARGHGMN
jgi:hypothetical protein